MLQCGPSYSKKGKSLCTFLLNQFPILSYHVKQSPVTLLVDGLNPPESILQKYFESRDPTSIRSKHDRKQQPGNKTESSEPATATEPSKKEEVRKLIEDEHIRLTRLCNAEFATEEDWEVREAMQFSLGKGALHSKSSKLAEFPSLIALIGKILKDHGDERAQKKRKDEEAHSVGCGVRNISEILLRQYGIDVSPSTVWRFGTSKRQRTVRRGGRYGFLKYQKVGVRNSQLHKPHCRGQYLAASVRGLKEFLTHQHINKMKVCFAGIDDMSLTPLIGDAIDHRSMHASSRGCTLEGDTHNNLDHNFGYFDHQGRSVKVRTTGVVLCYFDGEDNCDVVLDKHGREHYPRARVKELFVFNRDNHHEHGDATMSHWRDIESAFDSAYPKLEDQPEIFCVISDNGSGYDPMCPRNMHYAKLFMDRHLGIKFLVLMSFAAGESARNFEIERSWAALIKALIGQQLGSCCLDGKLRGPNGTLRGPANNEERKAVFEAAFKEFEDLWSRVYVSETDDYIVTPYVTHVEPYLQADIDEARRVHKFYMKDLSRKEILEMKDLRDVARRAYEVTTTTFNQTCIFRKDCHNDSFKTKLFGPSMRLLYPEEDTDLEDKRKDAGMPVIYNTFMQRLKKYNQTSQPNLMFDKNCPVPRCHSDKPWRVCCGHLITDTAKQRRHNRKNSPAMTRNSDPLEL